MELDQLAEKLSMLEANQQRDTQSRFMDKYGAKFSNDGDLGVAILGELNRRGVDVSAADRAVQEILDGLRSEATALLDKIKSDENQVSDLMDKLNTIDESVQAASGGDDATSPEASIPPAPDVMS